MQGTLLNQLQDWAEEEGIDPVEVRLVNRIDFETSGIVLAGLDLAAHRDLCAQMAAKDEGAVTKTYQALCGVPDPEAGEWLQPIGPGPA